MSHLPGYKVIEQLFANPDTVISRATCLRDRRSVIMRSINNNYPTINQLSRFAYSYELLKRFDHPNIVKVVDWVETDKSPVMVLEDSGSIDLKHYLETLPGHQLAVEQFLNIAIQMAEALCEIHHQRIIHKDLHPGNILISPETQKIQVIDFGLSSLLSREQPALKPPEQLEGMLGYVSPEQTGRMNCPLDFRTDFYTLGVTFYELISGKLPFDGDDALSVVHHHIARRQAPIVSFCPNVPPILSRIIDKLLAKRPESRYQHALGLKYDLEKAQQAWQCDRNEVFPLGTQDVSEQFRLPQRLYGRTKEIALLLDNYQKAVQGKPQMLAVVGYSGMGKTSLVNEIHKPIAGQKGLFIGGNFDQFLQNAPYAAVKQALRAWIRYALALDEHKLQLLQQRLHQTLGDTGRVLIDFMPKMALVLGPLPGVAILPSIETQARVTRVLCQFFQCVAKNQPLVLFIDNVQWADHGTLNLLQALMADSSGRYLILVAYRDRDMGQAHPTTIALNQIVQLQTLKLPPLAQADLEYLLSDILFHPTEKVAFLAQVIGEKTGGNPFFINEFLKQLYQRGALDFDVSQRCWRWHMEQVRDKDASPNVIDMLVAQVRQLPLVSQQLMQVAACLGSRFDLEQLAVAAHSTIPACAEHLWPALSAGLIIQEGGDWYLGVAGAIDLSVINLPQTREARSPQCRFLHDKVLQAVYDDIDITTQEGNHLAIGWRLFERYTEEGRDRYLFGLVKHLNKGRKLISVEAERVQLATLNEKAAQKAKYAGVWEDAGRYADIGMELLPDDSWKTLYALSFHLYSLSAECADLEGDYERAELLYQTLMQRAQSELEKARLCLNQMVLFLGRGRWDDAFAIGQQGLDYCGLHFPTCDDEISKGFPKIANELALLMEDTPSKEIANFPEIQDPQINIAMELIVNVGVVCFVMGKIEYLAFYNQQALVLIYKNGKNDFAALTLAFYAFLKIKNKQYSEAAEFAEQALQVMGCYPNCRSASNTLNMVAIVLHHTIPFSEARVYHQKGYHRGLAAGETLRAIVNLCNELILQTSQGVPLSEVEDASLRALQFIQSKRTYFPLALLSHYFSRSLQGKQQNISDQLFDPQMLEKIRSCFHVTYLDHVRFAFGFWSGLALKEQLCLLDQACSTIALYPCISCNTDHHLLLALTLIDAFSTNDVAIDRSSYLLLLENSCVEIQRLAKFCPNNFSHKHYLLLAEKHRLEINEPWKAIPYYEKSIRSAKENGFLQYEALANELYGLFWLRRDNEVIAAHYLCEAICRYEKWNCKVRIRYLQKHYGGLVKKIGLIEKNPRVATRQMPLNTTRASSYQSATDVLDLASIMKSASAISSEMSIDKLVTKLMTVIVENAGAQIGAIVLASSRGATLEAQLNMISGEGNYLQGRSLESVETLPISIVQTVLRADEPVVLQNGEESSPYQSDPYIQAHQPQSVLCVPIDHRDKLVGVLYLEHRELPQVFTKDRMELITLLQAQAAISLENARLFGELNQLNTELEVKVNERTAALQTAVEELHYLATRDSLTGIYNRRHFMDCAILEFDRAQLSNLPLAVMIIDIDYFKKVNDNYGHPVGDQVLIAVTKYCQKQLRSGDILGRLGGEEFGVLLPKTNPEEAREQAQIFVDSIRNVKIATDKGYVKITLSIGVCCLDFSCQASFSETLEYADEALYRAKNAGRDQVRLYG